MKFLKFSLLAVLTLSLGSLFVSCSDDDDATPKPVIDITNPQNTEIGEDGKLTLTGKVTSTANLVSITISIEKETSSESFKVIQKFDEKTSHKLYEEITGLTKDVTGIKVEVLDKDSNKVSSTLKVKFKEEVVVPEETKLTDAAAFTLTYKGTGAVTSHGITYEKNSTPTTASFTVSGTFVLLADKPAYEAIDTKEALKAKFDAGSKVSSFTSESDTKFNEKFLIVKDGETLRLVHMTDLKFAASNNVASFTERH